MNYMEGAPGIVDSPLDITFPGASKPALAAKRIVMVEDPGDAKSDKYSGYLNRLFDSLFPPFLIQQTTNKAYHLLPHNAGVKKH
jgi:hypothetical protein